MWGAVVLTFSWTVKKLFTILSHYDWWIDWFYEFHLNQTQKRNRPDLCKPKSSFHRFLTPNSTKNPFHPWRSLKVFTFLPLHIMRILIKAPFLAMASRKLRPLRHIRLADFPPTLQTWWKWLELFWRTVVNGLVSWYDVPVYSLVSLELTYMYYKYLRICSIECCRWFSNNS